jgi:hypothetical protein
MNPRHKSGRIRSALADKSATQLWTNPQRILSLAVVERAITPSVLLDGCSRIGRMRSAGAGRLPALHRCLELFFFKRVDR